MTWSMRLNGGDLILDGEPVRHETPDGAFTVTVVKDGTGFGSREPLTKTINTLMTQGSWEVVERFSNRAPAIVIEVEGETADGLNAGEVWLSALMTPGELEWLPPRQSVWTVFDVVTCYIDRTEDGDWDLDEDRWIRVYRVPIKALPNARSRDLTITESDTDATEPLVDDGTSASGWSATCYRTSTGTVDLAVTSTSGRIAATAVVGGGTTTIVAFTRAGTVDTTGYGYVLVEWTVSGYLPGVPLTVRADTTGIGSLGLAVVTEDLGGGLRRSYFRIGTSSSVFTQFVLRVSGWTGSTTGTATVEVEQVRLASAIGSSATGRQRITAIVPGGSAPADGSIEVYDSTNTSALGMTLVHTYPLGRPSPALLSLRNESAEPADDTTTIHGYRIPLTEPLELKIPNRMLPVRGLAALWGFLKIVGPHQITWTLQQYVGTLLTAVGDPQTGTVDIVDGADVSGSWRMIPLALLDLPPVVTGSSGGTLLTLEATNLAGGSPQANAAEVWTFGQDEESGLTVADLSEGTVTPGGPASRLWIEAPSAEEPAGRLLAGSATSDARTPYMVRQQQVHKLPAAGVSVLAATATGQPRVRASHYCRWTHHAGR